VEIERSFSRRKRKRRRRRRRRRRKRRRRRGRIKPYSMRTARSPLSLLFLS